MGIESSQGDVEDVALSTPSLSALDQPCNLMQLPRKSRIGLVVRLQAHVVEHGAQLLTGLDRLRECLVVLLAVYVAMLLAGDVGDAVCPDIVLVEPNGPLLRIDNLAACVKPLRPHRRSSQGKGGRRVTTRSQLVGDPSTSTPRCSPGSLTLERMCSGGLVRVGIQPRACPGAATLQLLACDGLHQRADVAHKCCLLLVLVQVRDKTQRRMEPELLALRLGGRCDGEEL
mmetsp:Transcript_66719/g.168333  ORF Transcript_66719/g.168333 Transcript_66719/m.168333 type:complete len:229 (+) Transcript_66719:689-1375(+)